MSLSNILGGALQGVSQGYEDIQSEQRKRKDEERKTLRAGLEKLMTDHESLPSRRQGAYEQWLGTYGIKDPAKAPPELQQLGQHIISQGPPPPPVAAAAGPPVPPDAVTATPSATPPPAPTTPSSAIHVPTRQEFAQRMGIPYATEDDVWNFKRQGYEEEYLKQIQQLYEAQRQQDNATATDARTTAKRETQMKSLKSELDALDLPNMTTDERIKAGAMLRLRYPDAFTAQTADLLASGGKDKTGTDPEIIKEYKFAQDQGFKGTLMDYKSAIKVKEEQGPVSPEREAQLIKIARASKDTGAADAARIQKSYEFNDKRLDPIEKPVSEALQRFGRLVDTVNQVTPQADALIAPELLTVMAGGQGSGLRMNEAEIARIVGGRTNLESLKASLNKWQIDPSKGLSVTAPQRAQIRALIATVHSKLLSKQDILNAARQELVDTDNPEKHKQIVVSARKKIQDIDSGQGSGPSATPPPSVGGAVPVVGGTFNGEKVQKVERIQ